MQCLCPWSVSASSCQIHHDQHNSNTVPTTKDQQGCDVALARLRDDSVLEAYTKPETKQARVLDIRDLSRLTARQLRDASLNAKPCSTP